LWNGKTITRLNTTKPFAGIFSAGFGINASAVVVGSSYAGFESFSVATLWEGTSQTLLADLGGNSGANSINDSGAIVGSSETADINQEGVSVIRAVLWSSYKAAPVDLGSLVPYNINTATGNSIASSINNSGQIVGTSDSADGLGHAVLWEGKKLLDLNELAKPNLPKNSVLTDASFIASNGEILVSVVDSVTRKQSAALLAPRYSTTTVLTSGKNPTIYGQTVALTAAVKASNGGVVTGTVTFKAQKAVFSTSALTVGTHSITAVYAASGSDLASTSAIVKQQIERAKSATSIATSLNPSKLGQSVEFIATIHPADGGAVTGTVVFKDGSRTLGDSLIGSKGSASFTTRGLAVGSHSITAAFDGNSNVAASVSGVLTQKVIR
jgi:probable HAF family extracellular repeat protein